MTVEEYAIISLIKLVIVLIFGAWLYRKAMNYEARASRIYKALFHAELERLNKLNVKLNQARQHVQQLKARNRELEKYQISIRQQD